MGAEGKGGGGEGRLRKAQRVGRSIGCERVGRSIGSIGCDCIRYRRAAGGFCEWRVAGSKAGGMQLTRIECQGRPRLIKLLVDLEVVCSRGGGCSSGALPRAMQTWRGLNMTSP
jgi:hypothetical protein